MQYGLEEVFEHTDPANARAAVQGLPADDKPFPGRLGQGCDLMALLRPVGLLDRFDDLIPEQPANPYLTAPEHQQQRVRRKNNG